MATITTADGIQIFYKDWGSGQPIVFSHGWPLSGDDWDTQMLFFLQHGYRVIAHDRRGHGRSTQTGDGHDMDHYADDLAALTEHLALNDAVHVGHSTGGGEVVHYIARHGESRVVKAVLISSVPPLMVQTEANPGGLPKSVFDDFQAQLPRIGRNSTERWRRDHSMASTDLACSPRKQLSITGGVRE
jgi:non-heme chloroperoxidase